MIQPHSHIKAGSLLHFRTLTLLSIVFALTLITSVNASSVKGMNKPIVTNDPKQEETKSTDNNNTSNNTLTVSYYGRLSIHPGYLAHPDAANPLWRLQAGEVIITSAQLTRRVPTHPDGTFIIHALPLGAYHLHAEFADFIFPTIRIEITQRGPQGVAIIRTYSNDGSMTPLQGTGTSEESPAIIPFTTVHNYYLPRERYSAWDFLKNPVMIMMLVSMGMVGLMKLMPEEDRKESARELQKLRKQFSGETGEEGKSNPAISASKGKK